MKIENYKILNLSLHNDTGSFLKLPVQFFEAVPVAKRSWLHFFTGLLSTVQYKNTSKSLLEVAVNYFDARKFRIGGFGTFSSAKIRFECRLL